MLSESSLKRLFGLDKQGGSVEEGHYFDAWLRLIQESKFNSILDCLIHYKNKLSKQTEEGVLLEIRPVLKRAKHFVPYHSISPQEHQRQ